MKLNGVAPWKVKTNPATVNEPPSTLGDGKIAANYGPVYNNGVSGGMYRIDLGKVRKVESVATVSYNQGGGRGQQRFMLFGSRADSDPGWGATRSSTFEPIGEVDTVGESREDYQVTRIHSSESVLGEFRWLLWRVYPVTDRNENTALQEFIVEFAE